MSPPHAASPLKLRTVLLLPPHVSPNPTSLPLLRALQSLLNTSYTVAYCAHPTIFGTSHLRLADPAQLADIIGAEGFTIAILAGKDNSRRTSTENGDVDGEGHGEEGDSVEVIATGSVKAFGNGNVKTYSQWSKNVSGTEWAARTEKSEGNGVSATSEEQTSGKDQQVQAQRGHEKEVTYEITAFAVSPSHQGLGLGARVLKAIERLVIGKPQAKWLDSAWRTNAPSFSGARLSTLTSGEDGEIHGIDLDKLTEGYHQTTPSNATESKPELPSLDLRDSATASSGKPNGRKLVLMGIRELGTEDYYQRRGYTSIWSGVVPVGMWDCRVECTTICMEKAV
jgi:hypothetical protein